jgi:energy-coupling factor transport system ATP-binding protein
VEIASAAVLGAVAVAFVLTCWVVPHLSGLATLTAVPMGVVAHRHRLRALVACAIAAIAVSFLVAGTGPISTLVVCALVGGIVGDGRRRGCGVGRALAATMVVAPILAALTVALLAVFSSLRKLTLDQLRNSWHGLTVLLGSIPGLSGAAHSTDQAINTAIDYWWVTISVAVIISMLVSVAVVWVALGAVLNRLAVIESVDRLEGAAGPAGETPGPLPLRLVDAHYRYPGTEADALAGVSLGIDPGRYVTVLGANGSGKSTLARILVGREPTAGVVERPGAAALGRVGGAAMVLQRPETQILGVRVADDVRWGLPLDHPVDVAALLHQVGLGGMEERDTSTLSGGELQRLALAGALARGPGLLVSDESTAMIDAEGRSRLTELFAQLPGERSMTVVHVTHRVEETAGADPVVVLAGGRVVADHDAAAAAPKPCAPSLNGHDPLDDGDLDVGELRTDRSPNGRPGGLLGGRGPDVVGPQPTVTPEVAGGTADRRAEAPTGRAARFAARLNRPARADADVGPAVGSGLLTVEEVWHTYAVGTPWAQEALTAVNLRFEPGSGAVIVGRNGSGKSTLAWVMAGLVRPTSGRCSLDGRPVAEQVGSVALSFQHARLQVQRATGRADIGAASGADRESVDAALESVGLDPGRIGDRSVDQLSGGQLRRVALAGLIARRPRVLLLDEPLAGLDDHSRRAVLAVLGSLRRDSGTSVIAVSHDLEGLDEVCDRVVTMEGGRVAGDRVLVSAWS